MIKTKLFAAAAVLSSLVASPVMAQDLSQQPTTTMHYSQSYNHRTSDYRAYNERQAYNERRDDSGFWPADVAAGIVGGAVGTAGAIATAPFRNDEYAYNDAYDSYAYDNNGPYMNDGQKASGSGGALHDRDSYAARNGFVCQPGTWFRGEDGRQHICQ
jgi:hypothetical protein